jgi:hypothetical protein
MVNLKLIAWDKYEAVYSWMGLHVIGREYDSDTFRWSFPEIDINKVISHRLDHIDFLNRLEIPRVGESLQKHLEGECKKELENTLTELFQDSINQQILIMMLFDNIVIIEDK